jgi:hypothetical protein
MTPVTRASAGLVAAGVTVVLLAGAPAHAATHPTTEPTAGPTPGNTIAGLLGSFLGQPPASAPEDEPAPPREPASYGSTHASDGVLRTGCRNYRYTYTVSPPTGDWTLETYLRDRTGESIASGAFMSNADAATQSSRFRFCRHGTRPGRFTIEAKLIWYDDEGDHLVWLEPSTFRLTRQR